MNAIIRAPEHKSLWSLFNDMDSMFDEWRPGQVRNGDGNAWAPAVDVTETENEYHVVADLPGVKREDLDVSIHDGVLTINAETKYEKEDREEGRLLRQERRYGKFVRSMRVGNDVDAEHIKAEYKDGVLDLRLPKHEQVKPKKIDVNIL